MSASLIKLIDASLLPAALMVVTKLAAVLLVILVSGVDWSIREFAGTLLSTRVTIPTADLQLVSNYSDLILLVVMVAGASIQLARAIYFHQSHINPKLLAKLTDRGLGGLVTSSFEVFHRTSVWVLCVWITSFTLWVNIVLGKTTAVIGVFALIVSIILTILLLEDVHREIEVGKRRLGGQPIF